MAEVTTEELIQIANSFLLASPPGEFLEVVTDVRGLLEDDSIINDTAPATFREYNTDQMVDVESPKGGHGVLITKFGEVGNGEYLDPRGKCIIQYDHIRNEVQGSRDAGGEIDGGCESLRAAVDDAFAKYAAEYYPQGTTTVYAQKKGSETVLTIALSAYKFNPNNFWNGRWRSVWTVSVGKGGVDMKGHLKANVHYYEDGNVQLNTDAHMNLACRAGDDNATANDIANSIKKCEAKYQAAIESSYNAMGDTTFKALRRTLPITRQKIDWDKIANYKLGGEVQ